MTDKKTWSLSDIGPAAHVTRERLMLIPEADIIGQFVFAGDRSCATSIKLAWDQWAVCTVECIHGKFRGTSDFLNLTEAVLRASERFRKAEHPDYCMADCVETAEDGTEFPAHCELWAGHVGDHGLPDDDDD